MEDREPREPSDFPLRAPRSSGQDDVPLDRPRPGPFAWLTGVAAMWWLFAIAALVVVALVWVFA